MKLSTKSIGFLVTILVGLCVGFLGAFMLLSTESLKEDLQNDSSTVSFPVSNPVSFSVGDTQQKDSLKYALITKDETIELEYENGSFQKINLNKQNWKNISISPDKENIAVLSDVNDAGVFDLYIYNLKTQKWNSASNYIGSEVSAGITSYTWKDNDLIYYTQGDASDHWLHTYTLSSGQIKKLSKVDGLILEISPDKSKILYASIDDRTEKYFFTTLGGDFILRLSDANPIEQVFFTQDINKLLVNQQVEKVNVVKQNLFGSATFDEVEELAQNSIICRVDNTFVSYNSSTQTFSKFKLDSLELIKISKTPASADNAKCFNDKIILSSNIGESNFWYSIGIQNGTIKEETKYLNYYEVVGTKNP